MTDADPSTVFRLSAASVTGRSWVPSRRGGDVEELLRLRVGQLEDRREALVRLRRACFSTAPELGPFRTSRSRRTTFVRVTPFPTSSEPTVDVVPLLEGAQQELVLAARQLEGGAGLDVGP